jgi:hypothetical protein
MIKSIMFIVVSCLVLILRKGDWNELIGHPKNHEKDSLNLKMNSLRPEENDALKFLIYYLHAVCENVTYIT